MDTVRAKFRCEGVEKVVNWNKAEGQPPHLYTARFNAVTVTGDENKKFWSATPCGEIKLTSVLVDAFEPGQEYYIDFSKA